MKRTNKNSAVDATAVTVIEGAAAMAGTETQATQVVFIPLDNVVDSPYNDRTEFDQASLEELADSIRQMGVLMPILVRPQGENYERIYGERRHRAAVIAGLETIPAYIKEISDKQAQELSTAENFFRENLTPLEESSAIERYIRKGYSVEDIVATFGMRKANVRLALKLSELYAPLKELLKGKNISLGIARELMQYPEHIQKEVYENHFADENGSQCWRQITVEKFRKVMKDAYTNDLNVYAFDREECANCANNTKCSMLFQDENDIGRCTKPSCLKAKNREYIITKVTKESFAIRNSVIAFDETADEEIVSEVSNMGYDIKTINYFDDLMLDPGPEPIAPVRDDYEEESDYLEVVEKHDAEVGDYKLTREMFDKDLEEGVLHTVIVIQRFDIAFMYIYAPHQEVSTTDPVITEAGQAPIVAEGVPVEEKPQTVKDINAPLINSLQERISNIMYKMNRNATLKREKLVDRAKEFFRKKNVKTPELSKVEEGVFFTLLIDKVRPENYTLLGLKKGQGTITDEHKKKVVAKLTPKRKAILMRDYLTSEVLGNVHCESMKTDMLLDLVGEHFPDELKEIEKDVEGAYSGKDKKLEEEAAKLQKELELLEKENELFEKEQQINQEAEDTGQAENSDETMGREEDSIQQKDESRNEVLLLPTEETDNEVDENHEETKEGELDTKQTEYETSSSLAPVENEEPQSAESGTRPETEIKGKKGNKSRRSKRELAA